MCQGDVSADTLFRGRSTLEVSGYPKVGDTLEVSGTPEVSRDTLKVIDTLEVDMRRKGEAKNGQIDNF